MNASDLSCGAAHQFAITVVKAGWEQADFTALTQSKDKCRAVLRFIRGEADFVVREASVSAPLSALDPIIRVDRSIKPTYPEWRQPSHPDLETNGPSEYNIATVEQWLHDGQKEGKLVKGHKIYDHLKGTSDAPGDLKNHLGLRDLEAIQKKGIAFFREHFAGKVIFGWAGIVRLRDGYPNVPYLYEHGDRVVLSWRCFGRDWDGYSPGLRHAKGTKV